MAMHVVGALPKKSFENEYVLAFTDRYTKLAMEIPITKITITYVAFFFVDHGVIQCGHRRI